MVRVLFWHFLCTAVAIDRLGSIDRSMSVVAVVAVDFGFSSVIRHTLTYILSPSSHLLDSLSFDLFLLLGVGFGFGFGFFFLSVPLEYGTTAVL